MKEYKKVIYKDKLVARLPKGVNSQITNELSGNLPGNQPIKEGFQLPEIASSRGKKPEKIVEDYLKRRCDSNNWWCLKEKVAGKRGWPDRTLLPGEARTLYVECKDRGKSPRPDQEAVHAELKARGFPVLLIDTKEKVLQLEWHIKLNIPIPPDSNLWHPEIRERKTRKPKHA